MPDQVRAVLIDGYGGPEVMRFAAVPKPAPGPGQVLVRLHAAGVNPVDWKVRDGQRRERMPLSFPAILGCDLSGTVEALGEGVEGFAHGEAVFGMLGLHGAFVESVAVPAGHLVPKPGALDHPHAAAVPLAALTAWQALHMGGIAAGKRVLVHAASGGVGGFAVQIANALGAEVVGTSSAANLDYVRALGAADVIDYRARRFEDGLAPVDLVLDLLGGETQDRSWGLIRPGGALISSVGVPEEGHPRRGAVRAARVGVRPVGADLTEIAKLIESGKLLVHLDATIPLSEAAAALERNKMGRTRGKISLLA